MERLSDPATSISRLARYQPAYSLAAGLGFTTLKRLYRTEEEKQIFQMMVEGASADEARDHIHQSTQTIRVGTTGDIELF